MKETEIIQDEINNIIKSFYKKNGKVKKEVVKAFNYEPINWGNFKCVGVEKKYVVYTEEASAHCENLKEYLRQELKKKGYDVEIVTEW
jgi:hypothetical protein